MIVVSLPGEGDVKYLNHLGRIAHFVIEMDDKTKGRDHLFIFHDKSGQSYLNHHTFTNAYLIEVDEALDLWMRDFPPFMPKQQIKFKYRPQYLLITQAKFDEGNFERFAKTIRLPKLQCSELVLEGGNIVNNGFDAAIIQPNDLSKTIQTCLKTSSSKNLKLLLNEKLQSCQIPTTQQGTPMVLCHLWKNMFC